MTINLSKSPDRYTFQLNCYIERCKKENKEPNEDYLNFYKSAKEKDDENILNLDWNKGNLEYDLRSIEWILQKVRNDRVYAQHLYAAICNNEFKELTNPDKKYWSVSWRYAGGIVANMCEIGDYIDWYCSGMISKQRINQVKWDSMSYEQQVRALQNQKFVSEGVISEQVLEDLNVLGWAPVFSDD